MMNPEDDKVDLETAEQTIDELAEGAKSLIRRAFQKGTATGLVVGLSTGAVAGYFIAKRHMQTKYSKIADDEIARMSEHFHEKAKAVEAAAAKRPVEDLVKERGYDSPESETPIHALTPPMVVKPPTPSEEEPEEPEESESSEPRNIFREVPPVDHVWDYQEELKRRSPDTPYVIHYDERNEMDDYDIVSLTYYEGDNVLCNEKDEIIDPDYQRDDMIGEKNLDRFGHGSNDPSIVYIRNDHLELVFEVVKSPHKFAEEVHGFQHDSDSYRNLERMRVRERDEQEDR